jgi:hypothetical protein
MTSDARSDRSASRHLPWLVALCATLCLGACGAPVPSGAAPPKGSYLTLVVNVSDGQVDDRGVGNHAADLASLGPVISLHL